MGNGAFTNDVHVYHDISWWCSRTVRITRGVTQFSSKRENISMRKKGTNNLDSSEDLCWFLQSYGSNASWWVFSQWLGLGPWPSPLSQTRGAPLSGYRLHMNTGCDVGALSGMFSMWEPLGSPSIVYLYIYTRRTYFQTVWQKLCQNGVSGWGSFEENSCCICMFLLPVFWLDATFRSSNAALKHPFSEVNYQPHCSPKAWNHDE